MKRRFTLLLLLLGVLPIQGHEYATHIAQFGHADGFLTNTPIDMTKETSETRLYYMLGSDRCYNGDLVTHLRFKGYNPGRELTRHVKVKSVYGFGVDEYADVFDGDCTIPSGGSAEEPVILLELALQQPVSAKGGRLVLLMESTGDVTDAPVFFESYGGEKPVMAVTVQSEVVNHEGIVTDQDGKPIAGASVCIYRPNYETGVCDFEFRGITDAEGCYSVRVEESNCLYNMSVKAEGFPCHVVNNSFAVKDGIMALGNTAPKDLSLWNRLEFTADQQATIFLPEAPDASWGRYYRFDRYEGWGVIFQREMNPQANVPYVIFPNHDFSIDVSDYDVTSLTETTPYDAVEGWGFNGSYQSKDFLFGSMRAYIIDSTPDCWDGHIPYPARVGAFRAYLIAYHTMSVTYGEPRCIFIDEQTGIDDVPAPEATSPIFDLQGRRINGKPEKGIYIQNGKKIRK